MSAAARAPLYDPAEHEPLIEREWHPARARAGIDAIVRDAQASFQPGRFWPRDPGDEYGQPQDRDRSLWVGAAGALWALDRLGAGLGEAGLYDAWRAAPDIPGSTGLMWGETGVLLVSWRLAPTAQKAARLAELVAGNIASPDCELFSGSPGTMLAALHLHEAGEPGAAELWRRCADALWQRFGVDPEYGCRLWIQYRRGRLIRSLGAGHGFASNARSLLRGRALLDDARLAELEAAVAQTALRLAVRDGALVNWPTAADARWAAEFSTRVQWCHGAPGFVTSLAALPHQPALDALLDGAGELVLRAGPLRKGAGLCHGTAGNGCALLALYERTGEERWLQGARRFAMHALEQVQRAPLRYSLWTGAVGVALFVQTCLEGRFPGMPIIDVL